MTLPGGPADRFGNSYEGRWTVRCMIDVLEERADAIRLEPPLRARSWEIAKVMLNRRRI